MIFLGLEIVAPPPLAAHFAALEAARLKLEVKGLKMEVTGLKMEVKHAQNHDFKSNGFQSLENRY